MKYILKNKNYNTYLQYIKRLKFKHYVVDLKQATLFNKTEVEKMLNKFRHPENWEVILSEKC